MSQNEDKSVSNQGESYEHPFHKRFNIDVGLEEAQQRFINRILTGVESMFPWMEDYRNRDAEKGIVQLLALLSGIKYARTDTFSGYVQNDFTECLRLVECLYNALGDPQQKELNAMVQAIISMSEVDLGIKWTGNSFLLVGAKLLDEALVNENLKWLSDPKYSTVLAPFEKGLGHYLEAQSQPEKLADVITDMYEALEKMARITNGNNKTLGGNAEQFIGNLNLSEYYKTMLREYTKYAHEFRHAVEQGKERVPPLPNEVEAFVYTTGLFIRLAIQQANR